MDLQVCRHPQGIQSFALGLVTFRDVEWSASHCISIGGLAAFRTFSSSSDGSVRLPETASPGLAVGNHLATSGGTSIAVGVAWAIAMAI